MIYRPRWHRQQSLADLEREVILAALYHNNGSRVKTAKELDISLRTMSNKLAEYRKDGFSVPNKYERGSAFYG